MRRRVNNTTAPNVAIDNKPNSPSLVQQGIGFRPGHSWNLRSQQIGSFLSTRQVRDSHNLDIARTVFITFCSTNHCGNAPSGFERLFPAHFGENSFLVLLHEWKDDESRLDCLDRTLHFLYNICRALFYFDGSFILFLVDLGNHRHHPCPHLTHHVPCGFHRTDHVSPK